jgi:hypothetical protein
MFNGIAKGGRPMEFRTMAATRILILIAAAIFAMAALLHFGMLLDGYAHERARIPETVIAIVLLLGLMLSWRRPPWSRRAAIAAQGFAILGILVGLTMIVIGIGPRTRLDLAIHAAMLTVLIIGLVNALRAQVGGTRHGGLRLRPSG